MARYLKNKDVEILEGNAYYWKITKKLLTDEVKCAHRRFILHNTSWTYCVFVDKEFLYASISNNCFDIEHLNRSFDMRVGIMGDDRKEIAAFKTDVISHVEMISYSQLDSILLKNKFLYLFVEIDRIDKNGQKIKVGKQMVKIDFKELLLSGENSDLTIEVKHKKFSCHRSILGSRAPIFAAMLDHDMKEKVSDAVTIKDAEPDVFQEFLLYLYSGNDDSLSLVNVADLYKLADKYGVEDLKIICTDKIKLIINKENFLQFFKLSRLYNDSAMTQTVIQFFLEKSNEIVQCNNWVTYLSENPVECNILITALAEKLQQQYSLISQD